MSNKINEYRSNHDLTDDQKMMLKKFNDRLSSKIKEITNQTKDEVKSRENKRDS